MGFGPINTVKYVTISFKAAVRSTGAFMMSPALSAWWWRWCPGTFQDLWLVDTFHEGYIPCLSMAGIPLLSKLLLRPAWSQDSWHKCTLQRLVYSIIGPRIVHAQPPSPCCLFFKGGFYYLEPEFLNLQVKNISPQISGCFFIQINNIISQDLPFQRNCV